MEQNPLKTVIKEFLLRHLQIKLGVDYHIGYLKIYRALGNTTFIALICFGVTLVQELKDPTVSSWGQQLLR